MNDHELKQTLHQIAEKDIPDMDKLPDIRRAILRGQKSTQYPNVQLMRVLRLVAILVILLLSSVMALAVAGALLTDRGLQEVENRGLVETLNLSQTIDDITVTIERGYADDNRVALWFRVDGLDIPEGYELWGIPFIVGMPIADNPEVTSPNNPNALSYTRMNWDDESGAGIAFIDTQRQLRYAINEEDIAFEFQVRLESFFNQPLYLVPEGTRYFRDEIPEEYLYEIPSNAVFSFDIVLPINQGLRIEPENVDVTVDGITVDIHYLRVAPSNIEVLLCYQSPDTRDWSPNEFTMTVGDEIYEMGGAITGISVPPSPDMFRCVTRVFAVPYDGTQDNLTFTVNGMRALKSDDVDTLFAEANANLAEYGIVVEHSPYRQYHFLELPPEDMLWEEVQALVDAELFEIYDANWTIEIPIPPQN